MSSQKYIPVVEIFGPTLQGEGTYAGKIVHFIRLGGCDFSCKWCDTIEARDRFSGQLMPVDVIVNQLKKELTRTVVITGGNPAIHNLTDLIHKLQEKGFYVHIETQGSIYAEWMCLADHITISPKGPSSGMHLKTDPNTLRYILSGNRNATLKFVISNSEDLDYAFSTIDHLQDTVIREHVPIILQPCTVPGKAATLPEQCINIFEDIKKSMERYKKAAVLDIRILPQMHVLYWGHKKGV